MEKGLREERERKVKRVSEGRERKWPEEDAGEG